MRNIGIGRYAAFVSFMISDQNGSERMTRYYNLRVTERELYMLWQFTDTLSPKYRAFRKRVDDLWSNSQYEGR